MSEIFAEPQIVNDVTHVDRIRLMLGRMSWNVKVARRFVYEEGRLEIAAFLIVYFGLDRIIQKANLVTAAFILDVQTYVLTRQPWQWDVQVHVDLARVGYTVNFLDE